MKSQNVVFFLIGVSFLLEYQKKKTAKCISYKEPV